MHDELYDEIVESETICERYLGISYKKFFIFALAIILLGVYISYLLFFGDNSLEVLLGLDEYEGYLKEEVYRLKEENAAIQKEYFELQGLRSDSQ